MLSKGEIVPTAYAKRMACQIAAQLPDDEGEALVILELVRELVANLGGGWGRPRTAELYVFDRTSPAAPPEGGQVDRNASRCRASQE